MRLERCIRTAAPDPAAVPRANAGLDGPTLVYLLAQNAKLHPREVAMRERDRGIWREFTWTDYLEAALGFAAGLEALGFEAGEGLLVIGDNRPRLYFGIIGAELLRGVATPVFSDLPSEEIRLFAENCRARFALAEDQEQVDKLLELRAATGKPDIIVYDDPRGLRGYPDPGLLAWDEVIAKGAERLKAEPGLRAALLQRPLPSDVAVLLHSSGTTGKPKGIALQHRRVIAAVRNAEAAHYFQLRDEVMAYLPMAWVGDFVFSVAAGIALRFCVNIPERQDLMLANLREVAPTVFFASPRAWDSLLTHVQVGMAESTRLKRRLFNYFMPLAIAMERERLQGRKPALSRRIMRQIGEWLIYSPLRDRLGLARVRRPYTAGEAIGEDTFLFFRGLGLDLRQFYGQTENAALTAAQADGCVKLETVGRPLPGVEVKIAESGEILVRADSVFDGYLGDESATVAALAGGWLHTGDAGYLDGDGDLVVLGRVSDMMVTAAGARYVPTSIENRLKFSPYVGEAAVIGAGRNVLTALICIDKAAVGHWAEQNGIAYTSYAELSQEPRVYELIADVIRKLNQQLPPALAIKRFVNLPKEFDPDDGEVTRTRKLRRNVIEERYAPVVQALYEPGDTVEHETRIGYENGTIGVLKRRLRIFTVA
ncbi:AMP-dependent synthetase/ligase [Rhodoligotrophos defluvii]|uniref:AMP-dependent synthetase/ligase n=1 Tax=Rhodoligotrophos defluvii TaxID=2561934 RepID=UPI0010C9904E|nr:AMP-binding protein [Rhodoligotrophos defluvii]